MRELAVLIGTAVLIAIVMWALLTAFLVFFADRLNLWS